MKDQILELIATSCSSNELADRLCEMVEMEKIDIARRIVEQLDDPIWKYEHQNKDFPCGNIKAIQWGIMKGYGVEPETLHIRHEDSRRDVGKGK